GQVVVRAVQVLGEDLLPLGIIGVQIHEVQHDGPGREFQGGLDRVVQTSTRGGFDGEPIHDHGDVVLVVAAQFGGLVQAHHRPVDHGPGEALGLQVLEQFDVLTLAPAHDRCQHLEAGALGHLQDPVHDLLRALSGDLAPAFGTVWNTDPCPQQPQVVVHLGDGADGGTRVTAGRFLVDGDRGRKTFDEVDVGFVHLRQELAGIGGQGLHVATLSLGEDRVEGQGGLPRTGQTGEHDHGVARQIQRDVLEVVFPGPSDHQLFDHRVRHPYGFGAQGATSKTNDRQEWFLPTQKSDGAPSPRRMERHHYRRTSVRQQPFGTQDRTPSVLVHPVSGTRTHRILLPRLAPTPAHACLEQTAYHGHRHDTDDHAQRGTDTDLEHGHTVLVQRVQDHLDSDEQHDGGQTPTDV